MTCSKILGLTLGAFLLLGYEAAATAAPMAASPIPVGVSADSGDVVQAVLGSERRQARRGERRVHRYERRSERYAHRQERRNIRHGYY